MPFLYSYRDTDIYTHHSLTPRPSKDEFPMHAHEWMEILYFISGKGSYLVEAPVQMVLLYLCLQGLGRLKLPRGVRLWKE